MQINTIIANITCLVIVLILTTFSFICSYFTQPQVQRFDRKQNSYHFVLSNMQIVAKIWAVFVCLRLHYLSRLDNVRRVFT